MLMLTGRNLGWVFNFGCGRMFVCELTTKQPNLKLKTWLKQLLGYLPLALALCVFLIFVSEARKKPSEWIVTISD